MSIKCITKFIAGSSAVALLASGCATNPDGSYEFKRTANEKLRAQESGNN